jgi:hypothetical protein
MCAGIRVAEMLPMKMIIFWDMAPCGLVKVDRRFRGAYGLHHQGDE